MRISKKYKPIEEYIKHSLAFEKESVDTLCSHESRKDLGHKVWHTVDSLWNKNHELVNEWITERAETFVESHRDYSENDKLEILYQARKFALKDSYETNGVIICYEAIIHSHFDVMEKLDWFLYGNACYEPAEFAGRPLTENPFEKAIFAFSHLLPTEDPKILKKYGIALFRLGNYNEAFQMLHFVKDNPEMDTEIYLDIALLYEEMGFFEDVEILMRKSIKETDFWSFKNKLADALVAQGKEEEAIGWYTVALKQDDIQENKPAQEMIAQKLGNLLKGKIDDETSTN
ncbi:hypothetical protein H8D59_03355 [bacterium]|nr:hypothetical protein [bacterium]